MPRPKGSKNKPKLPKTAAFTVGNPIPGDSNVSQQPHEASSPDAVATPETLALPDAESNGAPGIGSPVTHPDGRTGVVTGSEPRGSGWAVDVRWNGEDADTSYTPVDWREMQEASATQTAKAEPVRLPAPVCQRSLDDIGHDMAEAQADLDNLEREKAAIVKDYGKRIGTVSGRVSELAGEYRQAERREEIDYAEGVVNVYSNRTGELLATRPLADSERQQVLPLDHPTAPPTAEDDGAQEDAPAPVEDDAGEAGEAEDESAPNIENEEP